MSTASARPPANSAARRGGQSANALAVLVAGGLAALIALAVAVAMPKPSIALIGALIGAAVLLYALVFRTSLETGVFILAVYLGLLDGPVKLLAHNQFASATRDVLIAAVCAGALVRMLVDRKPIRLPPLSGWVLAFVAIVLIGAANPKTAGLLKIVGGYRQNLEWVPFFFFGYALIRSSRRFGAMFVILGVLALANGLVATYQTQIPVGQLAAWGPGYASLINGSAEEGVGNIGSSTRKYNVEGEGHVRPMALGADSGDGAGLGVIALPAALALLSFGGPKRRIYGAVLVLGSLVAILTGLGRLQVIGGLITVLAFAALALLSGRRMTRALRTLLIIGAIAIPLGAVFVSAVGSSLFSRYESIAPTHVVETSTSYKEQALELIPSYIERAPFGFGLGTVGPASAFGGNSHHVLENHGVTSETQYNFSEDETGAPGLLIFIGICVQVVVLLLVGLPKIPDWKVKLALAGVFASFLAHIVMGLRGSFMASAAPGAYFWFSFGIAAYWLVKADRFRKQDQAPEAPAKVAQPA